MSESGQRSRFESEDEVVVMKFGGTSVEDAAALQRLIAIVRSRMNLQPVLVVSALAKVTDQLLEAGRTAASGKLGAALALVRDIFVRHEHVADDWCLARIATRSNANCVRRRSNSSLCWWNSIAPVNSMSAPRIIFLDSENVFPANWSPLLCAKRVFRPSTWTRANAS